MKNYKTFGAYEYESMYVCINTIYLIAPVPSIKVNNRLKVALAQTELVAIGSLAA